METIVAVVIGVLLGSTVAATNPLVSTRWPVNILAGAAGGWLGARLGADTATEWVGAHLAGTAIAAAIGGVVVTVVVGVGTHLWGWVRDRRSARASEPPLG